MARPSPYALGALLAVGAVLTAPLGHADQAALAAWLTAAAPALVAVHNAELAIVPLVAPAYPPGAENDPNPKELLMDTPALTTPCAALGESRATLQEILPTPDTDLTVAVQQAVDDIETAVDGCTQVVEQRNTERSAGRRWVQRPLIDAENHLSEADVILTKLANSE